MLPYSLIKQQIKENNLRIKYGNMIGYLYLNDEEYFRYLDYQILQNLTIPEFKPSKDVIEGYTVYRDETWINGGVFGGTIMDTGWKALTPKEQQQQEDEQRIKQHDSLLELFDLLDREAPAVTDKNLKPYYINQWMLKIAREKAIGNRNTNKRTDNKQNILRRFYEYLKRISKQIS